MLGLCQRYNVSWLPWAWRPGATGPNPSTCQDLNGGPNGTSLGHATDGKGADFLTLWQTYYPPGPSPPSPGPPPPSGCPGGSLQACIDLCPSNPPEAYKDCVQECANRCTKRGRSP